MNEPVPIIVNVSGKLRMIGSPTGGIGTTGTLTENPAPPPPPQLGPSSSPPASTSKVRQFIILHLPRWNSGDGGAKPCVRFPASRTPTRFAGSAIPTSSIQGPEV